MSKIKQFYDFMLEREIIRQRRLNGYPMAEWTSDPVFQTYSFTNVKREHDRTTMRLRQIYENEIREMIMESKGDLSKWELSHDQKRVILLNCALYRFFGTVESARWIGWLPDWNEFTRGHVYAIGPELSFTSAYIVTSAGRSSPKFEVVVEFVDSIWKNSGEIVACETWEVAVDVMKRCYGVGSFMAKEIYLDYILATKIFPRDWTTWTPVGPGGKRGAARIKYGINTQIPETEALEVIRDVYAQRDEYWPDTIKGQRDVFILPKLDLTDIQFQCCEFDKYSRVAEGRKPKRLFKPKIDEITCAATDEIIIDKKYDLEFPA